MKRIYLFAALTALCLSAGAAAQVLG